MDEWRKYRLGDLFERVTRKNINLESENVLTISAQYGLINQEEFFNKSVAGKNLKNYYLLKKGEFAYNKSYSSGYPMGATKILENYDSGIVSTLYICFKSKSKLVNNEYFKYFFESKEYYDELYKIAQEGARNHGLLNVNTEDFFNIRISIPSIEEQEKIVILLKKIDIIIKKLEDEILLFSKIKKAVNTNILKSFNDRERIENIFKITRGYVLSKDKIKNEMDEGYKYPVYSSQTKNNGLLGYYKDYLYEDAITWTTDGANAGTVNFRKGKFYCTNVCGVLLDNRGYANECMAEILNQIAYKHVLYVGNPKLMNNVMAKILVPVPSINEQNKISNYLRKSINYETKLLDKKIYYQKLKKGLMQQLLTGKVRVKI